MSEVVVPKFPPTWEAWGNWCCCEAIMSPRQICCNGNMWFLAETGRVGVLFDSEQEIVDVGFVPSFYRFECRGTYAIIYTSPSTAKIWYKAREVYDGKIYGTLDNSAGYLVISTGGNAIAWFAENKIYEGEIPNSFSIDDTTLVMKYNVSTIHHRSIAWYLGKQFLDETARLSSGDAEYFTTWMGNYNGTAALGTGKMHFKGKEIYNGPMVWNPYGGHAMRAAGMIMISTAISQHGSSNGAIAWKNGRRIYENFAGSSGLFGVGQYAYIREIAGGAYLQHYYCYLSDSIIFEGLAGDSHEWCSGTDYLIITSETIEHPVLFFQGTIVYAFENGFESIECCGADLIAVLPNNRKIVFQGGRIIHDEVGVNVHCCNDYKIVQQSDSPGMAIVYFDGNLAHTETDYSSHICCNNYLIVIRNSDIVTVLYKGIPAYEGAYYEHKNCCGEFLSIFPSSTSMYSFLNGIQVEYEQESTKTYQCCVDNPYFVNDDETIDIWDADFGKMKFDVSTFDRIA